ncbi:VC0807 family protein [Fodinicola acaciae]|uniref:VC0807 family protein n=1 Tax=Fodinicola acaciae TaxID=2681555 RepID=UPI001C9E810D|nr:VC0807 family protein [Fodinicola acaciae]
MTTTETVKPAGIIKGLLPTIIFNVVLTTATYFILTAYGVNEVAALAVSGVWPVVEIAIVYAKQRRLDELSLFVLVLLAIGVVSSLAFNSPRIAILKDSAPTALFGIVLLVSLLFPRPLMFFFGRRFATDGTPAGVQRWNDLWQYAGFRRAQRVTTIVWGVSFLAEVAVRTILTFLLPFSVMVVISQVLPIVVIVALIIWTIRYGQAQRRKAGNARME